jgi:hypothetical protein
VKPFNIGIKAIDERPDKPGGDVLYLVKDIFTTRDGSWELSDKPGSINQWARDAYLKPFGAPDFFDDAGGDHHLFAAIIGLDGQLMREKEVIFWSDGFDKLGDANYQGYVLRQTKSHSGWANIVSGSGSSFVPERGESGPWCWAPAGAAEVVCGGGMPAKQHVSMFVVWQAVKREDVQGEKPGGTELDHTIFLPFVTGRALAPAAAPATVPVDPSVLSSLRSAVWQRLGLEFRADSVLADYARRHNLGMPVTQEFETGGYRVQGYYGGIVYAPVGQPGNVAHMGWCSGNNGKIAR